MLRELLELLFPAACARCGRGIVGPQPLCADCDAALPRLPVGRCLSCQDAPPALALPEPSFCFACRLDAPPWAACLAAAPFEGEVASFLRRFKSPLSGFAGLAPGPQAVVEALVCEAAGRAPGPRPAAVLPIPFHAGRLRTRGFDPAALLAAAVARAHRLRLAPRLLTRAREARAQTGLDRAARLANVAGAFRVRGRLPGPTLWVVDDVVTTGSTLAEAARTLQRAGAAHVVALAAARTPSAR